VELQGNGEIAETQSAHFCGSGCLDNLSKRESDNAAEPCPGRHLAQAIKCKQSVAAGPAVKQ